MNTLLVTGSKGLIGTALTVCLNQLGFGFKPFDVRFERDHPGSGDGRNYRAKHARDRIHKQRHQAFTALRRCRCRVSLVER